MSSCLSRSLSLSLLSLNACTIETLKKLVKSLGNMYMHTRNNVYQQLYMWSTVYTPTFVFINMYLLIDLVYTYTLILLQCI